MLNDSNSHTPRRDPNFPTCAECKCELSRLPSNTAPLTHSELEVINIDGKIRTLYWCKPCHELLEDLSEYSIGAFCRLDGKGAIRP